MLDHLLPRGPILADVNTPLFIKCVVKNWGHAYRIRGNISGMILVTDCFDLRTHPVRVRYLYAGSERRLSRDRKILDRPRYMDGEKANSAIGRAQLHSSDLEHFSGPHRKDSEMKPRILVNACVVVGSI